MIKTWTIAITEIDSNEPVLFFNDVRDKWVNEFQGGCAFYDEESANHRLKDLNVDGARVIKGTVK